MKTFTYAKLPMTSAEIADAVAYTDERPLEVVRMDSPEAVRFMMRGEPDPRNGNHHYMGSSEEDLAAVYAEIQALK